MNRKPSAYIRLRGPSTTTASVHTADGPVPTVEELMAPDPIVVTDDTPIEVCIRMLEESEVSGLPVVDAEGILVGVISETDIVHARATEYLWERWPRLQVRHLMHAPVLTADRSMGMEEAAQLMERAHVHRLVVVDDEQMRPIGVISTSDVVRSLAHRPTDG